MKKVGILFLLLILLGGGLYLFGSKYGFQIGSLRFAFSKEKSLLSDLTRRFLEDIRFKDFARAAGYHSPEDQDKVDIPKLIERLFKIKPELLD